MRIYIYIYIFFWEKLFDNKNKVSSKSQTKGFFLFFFFSPSQPPPPSTYLLSYNSLTSKASSSSRACQKKPPPFPPSGYLFKQSRFAIILTTSYFLFCLFWFSGTFAKSPLATLRIEGKRKKRKKKVIIRQLKKK